MSWYELDLSSGFLSKQNDSYETWANMLTQQTFYWYSLISKWLIINPPKNSMILLYDELVSKMEESIRKIIHYMNGGHDIDEIKLKRIILSKQKHKIRNFKEFKYFDEREFLEYEILLSPYLSKLNIQPLLLNKN
jgi:hypothetical protein